MVPVLRTMGNSDPIGHILLPKVIFYFAQILVNAGSLGVLLAGEMFDGVACHYLYLIRNDSIPYINSPSAVSRARWNPEVVWWQRNNVTA